MWQLYYACSAWFFGGLILLMFDKIIDLMEAAKTKEPELDEYEIEDLDGRIQRWYP